MRTAFSVAALLGLAAAQYNSYRPNTWQTSAQPYQAYPTYQRSPVPTVEPIPDEEEEEEDFNNEIKRTECAEKIAELATSLDTTSTACSGQSSTLAGITSMVGTQTSMTTPIMESIFTNEGEIAFQEEANILQTRDLLTATQSIGNRIDSLQASLNDPMTGVRTNLDALISRVQAI